MAEQLWLSFDVSKSETQQILPDDAKIPKEVIHSLDNIQHTCSRYITYKEKRN